MTTTIFCPFSINSQSRQTDSNRRPADYKSAALPTELCRHLRAETQPSGALSVLTLYAIFYAMPVDAIDCEEINFRLSCITFFDRSLRMGGDFRPAWPRIASH